MRIFHANQTSMCLDPHLNLGWSWCHETSLSPLVKYFTDPSKASLLILWIICVIYVLGLSFFRACPLLLCSHLLGKGWPFVSRLWCYLHVCHFPMWYPGLGVVLNSIVSWALPPFLLCCQLQAKLYARSTGLNLVNMYSYLNNSLKLSDIVHGLSC